MKLKHFGQRFTALTLLGAMTTSVSAPLVAIAPAIAQSTFNDVQGSWAQACISNLSQRNIISGYPDGSFRPNAPVTRAEFASMLRNAFPNAPRTQAPLQFVDVSPDYWAYSAVRQASQTGFLSGYPGNVFNPNQNIPRAQVLVSLANGLNYAPSGSVAATLSQNYADAAAIPTYARNSIAAATNQQLVVNYPDVRFLNPNQLASRAEVAAFLCQALTGPEQASLIPTQFIAGSQTAPVASLPSGSEIPVQYDAERIIVAPNETVPLTLTVVQDVRNSQGVVVIPRGSQIVGQLQPVDGGSQFVARTLVVNGQEISLNAASAVVRETRSVRDPDFKSILAGAAFGSGAAAGISAITGDVDAAKVITGTGLGTAAAVSRNRPITSTLRDAALGAAAASVISVFTGDKRVAPEEALGGVAAGATIGGLVDRPSERVIVIDPDTDLTVTLESDLTLR